MSNKEYKLNIDPRILELLGPSLYTNIYYILAELIANAYDADARNVYIIANKDNITVEDDGTGMSYVAGDVQKYLNVAAVSRKNSEESTTSLGRQKMGRKGVGKLAALSVSANVIVKTISDGDKSGFVLSRYIAEDNLLKALGEDEITFEKITDSGTSVVMENPQYHLHSTLNAVKRNLIKIFPLVSADFKIHIIRGREEVIIENFDKEMIKELSTLITLGEDFKYLSDNFDTPFQHNKDDLLNVRADLEKAIIMKDNGGTVHEYTVQIKGWIGTYKTTRGRRAELTDFPDNFISLYANKKMGEFNVLPVVSQNKLPEVYVVGQLHVDIFELTELPDMALSNRQGYKSDDPRYQAVLELIRTNLLPGILSMRETFVKLGKKKKEQEKIEEQKQGEADFRRAVDSFRSRTSRNAANKMRKSLSLTEEQASAAESILYEEINSNSGEMGIKSKIDSQKKRVLISQTRRDKDLADVIYNMLIYNNVPADTILYTNCDDEVARIPIGYGVYDYLRDFFVDSYSTQKMVAIFVTSDNTRSSWGALIEVGAAWITQIEHKIFNIRDFRPEHPLDDEQQWHTSSRDSADNTLYMQNLDADIFSQNIEYICDQLGYPKRTRLENKTRLETLMSIK